MLLKEAIEERQEADAKAVEAWSQSSDTQGSI